MGQRLNRMTSAASIFGLMSGMAACGAAGEPARDAQVDVGDRDVIDGDAGDGAVADTDSADSADSAMAHDVIDTGDAMDTGGGHPIAPADDLDPAALTDDNGTAWRYEIALPEHLLTAEALDNTPDDNPTTDAGAALGRVLFYDRTLSASADVACASCHLQGHGFSDPAVFSVGVHGFTGRNSMGLANGRFYRQTQQIGFPGAGEVATQGAFFWDERAASLEEQVLMPLQAPGEMAMTLDGIVAVVEGHSYYAPLFQAAFGDAQVDSDRISKALAQFVRSMVSVNAKYDVARANQQPAVGGAGAPDFVRPFPAPFTDAENRGKALFYTARDPGDGDLPMPSCVTCHVTEAQINTFAGATNNGLDAVPGEVADLITTVSRPRAGQGAAWDTAAAALLQRLDGDDAREELGDTGAGGAVWRAAQADLGVDEIPVTEVESITEIARKIGKFKVPSLRNVAVTGPYMHDGRFADLHAVIDHYSEGVADHPNLRGLFRHSADHPQAGQVRRYGFTEAEKQDLIAFLETLTDEAFLSDRRWSDPFIRD